MTFPAGRRCAAPAAGRPERRRRAGAVAPFTVDYVEGADVGYRWYALSHVTPLFPFGFGLSYTTFRYGHVSVDGLQVGFDVTNTGTRPGPTCRRSMSRRRELPEPARSGWVAGSGWRLLPARRNASW